MTDVNATLLDNTDTQDNDNTTEKKPEKKKLSLGWWILIGILAAVTAVIIGLIIWAVCSRNVKTVTKKPDDDDEGKEGFSASNSISNEYDYVNSVIYATLGDMSGLEKINANAVAA